MKKNMTGKTIEIYGTYYVKNIGRTDKLSVEITSSKNSTIYIGIQESCRRSQQTGKPILSLMVHLNMYSVKYSTR